MIGPNRAHVAYLCSPSAFQTMDRCEGVAGGHYDHIEVRPLTDDDQELSAATYVAGPNFVCAEGRPSKPAPREGPAAAEEGPRCTLVWMFAGCLRRSG